jgi:hypothetical protein
MSHQEMRWRAFASTVVLSLALAPSGFAANRYGRGDTGVVTVSSEAATSQGEEPLAVNPLNPKQLTTVANVFEPDVPAPLNPFVGGGGLQDTRVFSSRDGGAHWITQKLDQGGLGKLEVPLPGALEPESPEFSDAFNIVNTDADAVWDSHGNAYYESGDIHGLYHGGNEVETVWRSTDGGVTWGPDRGYTAVNATEEHNELDRPWLAVDNSGGAHDGRLYTTFETTPFVAVPPEVYVKHSDDHGATWSATVRVDDGTYQTRWNPRNRPAIGAEGTLYDVYDRAPITDTPFLTYEGPISLVVARSHDGGETFERTVVDSEVQRIASPDEATPQYTEMIPAIANDPQHAGRVAVAWPQAVGSGNSRIMLRYSTDGGVHWSPRIDVADDPASQDDQHDHVTLAWLASGKLFVGWRDRRCCGGTFSSDYAQWVRVLNPAPGGTFVRGRALEFSEGPQPPTTSDRGALQPDEFQGLVATKIGVALTWSQVAASVDHLVFRRVPLGAFSG